MNYIIRHIERIQSAIDLISSSESKEEEIDTTLFYLIKKYWVFKRINDDINEIDLNIKDYIKELYKIQTNYTSRESLCIKKVKELSLVLAQQLDTLPHKSLERYFTILTPYSIILKYPCPILARQRFINYFKRHRALNDGESFEFDTLYKINWASQLCELHAIKAIETKKALALYYIRESIMDMIFGIKYGLASFGIMILKNTHRPIRFELRDIYASCSHGTTTRISKIYAQPNSSSTDILNHCRPHIKGLYKEKFEQYLEELKEKFCIYPSGCSLKFFSAIAHILYDNQYNLGMKGDYNCFSKFKNDLGRYYGLDSNTYKPKDLIDLINNIQNDPIFRRINPNING